jgi:VanZ family protein
MKIRIRSFFPAICVLIIATLLFCLPGDQLSEAGWLEDLELDKVVHVGLFAMLVFLWCLPAKWRVKRISNVNTVYGWITILFIAYGVAIEFIQRYFIPYRSFDFFDIVADTVGCAIGWIAVKKLAP